MTAPLTLDQIEDAEEFVLGAKFTPGPWTPLPGNSVISIMADSGAVATVGNAPYYRKHDQTDVANARLIAAAPDLLSALKAVVSVADRSTVEFDAARAAISRATGGRS